MIVAVVSLSKKNEAVMQTLYNKIARSGKTIELSAGEKEILTILLRNVVHSIDYEASTKDNNTK